MVQSSRNDGWCLVDRGRLSDCGGGEGMLRVCEEPGGDANVMVWHLPDGGVRRFLLCAEDLTLRAHFAPFEPLHQFVGILLGARPRGVVVEVLSGVSAELARIALALGFPVTLQWPAMQRVARDVSSLRWLQGLLSAATRCLPPADATDEAALRALMPDLPACVPADENAVEAEALAPAAGGAHGAGFGYEAYAFGNRDHNLLLAMQARYAVHFDGCERVLDLGCGTGVFLEVLARQGLAATGVERNAMSVRFARSLGHTVVEDDALAFLATQEAAWDGVYCSHFIEHLPVEAAELLLRRTAAALRPGGVAVFVFPDPESIRSQLLGFWRDPEHVRFYHPDLVTVMAAACGLELAHDGQRVPGRRVVSFELEPPLPPHAAPAPHGWLHRGLARLGLATRDALQAERARVDALEHAVRRLWEVNQTWAWDDNALLCFRKPMSTAHGAVDRTETGLD